jgi:thioesterase domain-containing protein
LDSEKITARVVIQKNTMHYEAPIAAAFVAEATIDQAEAWTPFMVTLQRRKRARIAMNVVLRCKGEKVGELEGDFVAIVNTR